MLIRFFLFASCILSIFLLPHVPQVVAWDQAVVQYLAAHRSSDGLSFFYLMTKIGGTWGFLSVLLFIIAIHLFQCRFATALIYLVGVGLLKLSVSWLKVLVARPRPAEAMYILNSYSMPSGHAVNAVLIFGVLAILSMKKISQRPLRWFVFLLCLFFAFSVSASRVYLGVHYPSDVLMGMLYAACGLWILQGLRPEVVS
jgi:undecaprenyl-diphosphatase